MPYGSLDGRQLPPDAYQARLTHDDDVATAAFRVVPDPRRSATTAQYAEQDRLLAGAQAMARDLYESVILMQSVSGQVQAVIEGTSEHEFADTVAAAGTAVTDRIEGWEDVLVQPDQKTFQDVINFLNQLDAQILALVQSVDGSEPPVTRGVRDRLRDLRDSWSGHAQTRDQILALELAAFESLLDELGIQHIVIPRTLPGARPITQDGAGGNL